MTDIYYLARSESAERTPEGCTTRETYRLHAALILWEGPSCCSEVFGAFAILVRGRPGRWAVLRQQLAALPIAAFHPGEVVEYDGHEIADGYLIYTGDLDDEIARLTIEQEKP